MSYRFWEYLDKYGTHIIILAVIFLIGFLIGVNTDQPEPESNFIIYDYPLTEEEVFERYEQYLNDKWYFTLNVDEYEISKEKVIEIIEEWLFEDTQPWDAEYRTPPEYW